MTSKENNDDTINFFEDNNYFEYPKDNIKFFMQEELPMVDENGEMLLNEEGIVKEAADGHGGVFNAIFKNDILTDMREKGIEWFFIVPVDNPLLRMVDEEAIGITIKNNVLVLGKSLVKKSPEEKVGVFCKKNGRTSVVEYINITEEMANQRDEKGELVYGEAHILCNMFNIKAIEKIEKKNLPYMAAHKKTKFMNDNGEIIEPSSPNAYKFECFIFDAFEEINSMIILRVKREEEFAPVKNVNRRRQPSKCNSII